jgi:two-component system, OmpR family, response regulator
MPKKIVIIDDETAFCNLLAEIIESHGDFLVKTYTSSSEALTELSEFKPDAIFVDMLMPDNDGGSVIKSIKEKMTPPPLIIMVTGMVTEDEVSNSELPVLAKPINMESLQKVLALLK